MEGLQITATLKSPIIVGSSAYMTLDGILGAVLFDQLQDVDAAHAAIPIKQQDGLFHASAVITEPIDKGRTAFIAGLYPSHSIDPALILKNKRGALHRSFDSSLTNVMNTYRQITALNATWYRPKGMWRKTFFKLTGKLDNGYGRLREALAVMSPL